MIYGYARVSTKEQNLDRQLSCMYAQGLDNKSIFIDKQSGKDFIRNEYQKLLKKIKKDDLLIIMSIDRLGRNYEEILKQYIYREITCIKASELLGVSRGTLFRVLKDKSLKQKEKYKIVAYKKNGEKIETKSFLSLSKKLYVSVQTIKNFMNGKNTLLNDDIEKIEKVYYKN